MISMEKAIEIYNRHGGHFFDEDTMNFFKSEIESILLENRCFVTSEYDGWDEANRAFTIRQFSPDFESVDDVSEYREFKSLPDALLAAAAL